MCASKRRKTKKNEGKKMKKQTVKNAKKKQSKCLPEDGAVSPPLLRRLPRPFLSRLLESGLVSARFSLERKKIVWFCDDMVFF
jgi:hypothetical protein